MNGTTGSISRRIKMKPLTNQRGTPTVSVVISCYNYGQYLEQAVVSCLTQQDVDVDVIIVDDASTDSSLAVARRLAGSHRGITVLAHAENRGVVEAFNHGARAAKGEFLVRLDADDLLTPGALRRATLLAKAFPSVGLVYGHPLHFHGTNLPTPRPRASAWTIWPGLTWLGDRCSSGKNVITSPEVLMRRSLVEELGYLAPLRHCHDMELWLRLAAFADVAYIHGADQAWHREHPASMSAREVDGLVDLHERLRAFEALAAGPAGNVPAVAHMVAEARSVLVNEALDVAWLELDRGLPRPELVAAYRTFALSTEPDVQVSRYWRRLTKRLISHQANPRTASSLARRAYRRVRSDLSWYRWQRNGVY